MNFDTIIAIDGGISGAIVTYRNKVINVYKLSKKDKQTNKQIPLSTGDIKGLLQRYKDISENPILFIEKINTFFSDNRFMVHAIEKLGKENKKLITVAEMLEIPVIEVGAKKWQNHITKKKAINYTDRKMMLKQLAIQIFEKQNIRVTGNNADALLILHFVNMEIKNETKWIKRELKKLKL